MERFKPMPYEPDLPFDWQTGGRQLSEEELKIARRLINEGTKKTTWPTPALFTDAPAS